MACPSVADGESEADAEGRTPVMTPYTNRVWKDSREVDGMILAIRSMTSYKGRANTTFVGLHFPHPTYPSPSITMAALVNILSAHAKRQVGGLDYNSAPPNLSTLGNNTLFDTWRPKAHVLPRSNHIGDPCSELLLPRH